MPRVLFPVIGALEWLMAAVLVWLGCQLPSRADVSGGFAGAERVTQHASEQVAILRKQVRDLRRPEMLQLAERLQSQTRIVAGNVKNQPLDFHTIEGMRDALAQIADSLEGLARDVRQAPELRTTLRRSAVLLRTSSQHMTQILEHRDNYEETVRLSVTLAETFAASLPLITEQLDARLAEEEHALNELSASLDDVSRCLPVYARTTQDVIGAGRLLAWLGACIAFVHGCHLALSARLTRRETV